MIESVDITIWGREFNLPVEYDCYDGEVIIKGQIDALETFIARKDWLEKAKCYIEAHCKAAVMDDDENHNKDNIFSYIKPECIFIKHEVNYPRLALMCKYRYDPEHGLAVVFSHNGTITVGIQDIIL